MNIRSILICLCLLVGLSGQNAKAQALSAVVDIDFGSMVVGGASTVTVDADDASRTSTGLVALIGCCYGVRGSVTVTFTPGATITITIPASIVMTGANAPVLTPTFSGSMIQTMPPSGLLTVYIGGTITFATSGAYGPISATVPVTIEP